MIQLMACILLVIHYNLFRGAANPRNTLAAGCIMLNTACALPLAIIYFGRVPPPLRGLLVCWSIAAASTLFHDRLSEDALWVCFLVSSVVTGCVQGYAMRHKQKVE